MSYQLSFIVRCLARGKESENGLDTLHLSTVLWGGVVNRIAGLVSVAEN